MLFLNLIISAFFLRKFFSVSLQPSELETCYFQHPKVRFYQSSAFLQVVGTGRSPGLRRSLALRSSQRHPPQLRILRLATWTLRWLAPRVTARRKRVTGIARDLAVRRRSRRRKPRELRPTWKILKDSWSATSPRAETGPCGRLDCAVSCVAGKERRLLQNSRSCMELSLPVAETPPESASSRRRRRAGAPVACGAGDVWQPAGRRRSPGRRSMGTAP